MRKNKVIIKNREEIEKIRISSQIAANALVYIEPYVKEWITTEELDHICNSYIISQWWKSACIWYHGYPKYTCISLNDTICHWIPNKWEKLKKWDILNIDITVYKDWYFWDTSKMYKVWEINSQASKLIEITKKALDIWIWQVYPWNMTWNIWYEIAKYIEPRWFSVVREYTWHWIGLYFHEEPYIYHKSDKNSWIKMEAWMIFTIEPMINMGWYKTKVLNDKWTVKTQDGKLSAQFEHTILVTDNWYEILSLPTI